MRYKSLRHCLEDLEREGHLIRIRDEVDPALQMAEVHRRVHEAGGPALLFENVKGSPFPAASNIFGTLERSRFIFRSTLQHIKQLIELKADPVAILRAPWESFGLLRVLTSVLPKKVRSGPVLRETTRVDQLPQVQCWPDDGGPFVLLPQVYTEDALNPGIMTSNLGMYRIQLSGNEYRNNEDVGLHYQIRRDIGIHHTNAIKSGKPLKVSVFVGGPPAHTFAAVMPLPEGLSEVMFAGGLAGRRFRHATRDGFRISTDADFCITGAVTPGRTLPEGPFGDHLGYYSLRHEFPVLEVHKVYHRPDAVWPFTVVGRPPQEDTSFGELIHEITGPMVPVSVPGLKAINAVDAAGVHPLLLAIGSERYEPYRSREPQEILTLANALLGFGACSLAKYLFIAADGDDPDLDIHDIERFFTHVLRRVDWRRDLHFHTRTTIDTLDYSGTELNRGSKLVIACAGEEVRNLAAALPDSLRLPGSFDDPRIVSPGILTVRSPSCEDASSGERKVQEFCSALAGQDLENFPLIVLVDDSEFTARTLRNFLWVTFTRSNPSHDVYGVDSFVDHKHWGCRGPLVIDARLKPHHAPPLVEDPGVTRSVDKLGKAGGPLHGII